MLGERRASEALVHMATYSAPSHTRANQEHRLNQHIWKLRQEIAKLQTPIHRLSKRIKEFEFIGEKRLTLPERLALDNLRLEIQAFRKAEKKKQSLVLEAVTKLELLRNGKQIKMTRQSSHEAPLLGKHQQEFSLKANSFKWDR
jgi:hypothetical protein